MPRIRWEYEGKKRFDTSIDYESGTKNCLTITPRRYMFLEVIDMPSATGEDDRANRWNVEVTYVDLDEIPEKEIKSALQSCGWEGMPKDNDRALAEVCDSYGLHAHVHQNQGSNRRKLMAEAYKIANEMARDKAALEDKLDSTANKIGSTQREMMKGDVYAGLARSDSPEASIVRKMTDACTYVCPECHGTGKATDPATKAYLDAQCPTCEGKGKIMNTLGGAIPAPG